MDTCTHVHTHGLVLFSLSWKYALLKSIVVLIEIFIESQIMYSSSLSPFPEPPKYVVTTKNKTKSHYEVWSINDSAPLAPIYIPMSSALQESFSSSNGLWNPASHRLSSWGPLL